MPLVAEAQDELADAVGGAWLHDVPEDRAGLRRSRPAASGQALGQLAEPRVPCPPHRMTCIGILSLEGVASRRPSSPFRFPLIVKIGGEVEPGAGPGAYSSLSAAGRGRSGPRPATPGGGSAIANRSTRNVGVFGSASGPAPSSASRSVKPPGGTTNALRTGPAARYVVGHRASRCGPVAAPPGNGGPSTERSAWDGRKVIGPQPSPGSADPPAPSVVPSQEAAEPGRRHGGERGGLRLGPALGAEPIAEGRRERAEVVEGEAVIVADNRGRPGFPRQAGFEADSPVIVAARST